MNTRDVKYRGGMVNSYPLFYNIRANILDFYNQHPRRKRRGTVLNVSHCVFYKVVAVGFNTLLLRRRASGY